MKTELSKIAQDLEQGTITEYETRTLLLGLLSVNNSLIDVPLTYCPKCKSTDVRQYTKGTEKCNNCNHAWDIYRPFKGVF